MSSIDLIHTKVRCVSNKPGHARSKLITVLGQCMVPLSFIVNWKRMQWIAQSQKISIQDMQVAPPRYPKSWPSMAFTLYPRDRCTGHICGIKETVIHSLSWRLEQVCLFMLLLRHATDLYQDSSSFLPVPCYAGVSIPSFCEHFLCRTQIEAEVQEANGAPGRDAHHSMPKACQSNREPPDHISCESRMSLCISLRGGCNPEFSRPSICFRTYQDLRSSTTARPANQNTQHLVLFRL